MDEPAGENKSVQRPKDPFHGVTLEKMLNSLVDQLGWDEMARRVKIACFIYHPSIPSSLKFLRKTPSAREKVEKLYLRCCGG